MHVVSIVVSGVVLEHLALLDSFVDCSFHLGEDWLNFDAGSLISRVVCVEFLSRK